MGSNPDAKPVRGDLMSNDANRLRDRFNKTPYCIRDTDPLRVRKIKMDETRRRFREESENYIVQAMD